MHVFHHELAERPSRPAACHLIEGKLADVERFLNTLTYGEASAPEAKQEYTSYQEKTVKRDAYFRYIQEAKWRRQGRRPDGD